MLRQPCIEWLDPGEWVEMDGVIAGPGMCVVFGVATTISIAIAIVYIYHSATCAHFPHQFRLDTNANDADMA